MEGIQTYQEPGLPEPSLANTPRYLRSGDDAPLPRADHFVSVGNPPARERGRPFRELCPFERPPPPFPRALKMVAE